MAVTSLNWVVAFPMIDLMSSKYGRRYGVCHRVCTDWLNFAPRIDSECQPCQPKAGRSQMCLILGLQLGTSCNQVSTRTSAVCICVPALAPTSQPSGNFASKWGGGGYHLACAVKALTRTSTVCISASVCRNRSAWSRFSGTQLTSLKWEPTGSSSLVLHHSSSSL